MAGVTIMPHVRMVHAVTGLPEPRANPLLVGHSAAVAQLARRGADGSRMHHAWLITGAARRRQGDARLPLRATSCWPASPAADSARPSTGVAAQTFRRVAASAAHADLLTVEREWDEKKSQRLRGEIVVADDARAVAEFLHLTPAEGGWRVVVIDGVEEMNRNAANALLKMLEEPPPQRRSPADVCSCDGPAAADHPQPLPPAQAWVTLDERRDGDGLLALAYLPKTPAAEREPARSSVRGRLAGPRAAARRGERAATRHGLRPCRKCCVGVPDLTATEHAYRHRRTAS